MESERGEYDKVNLVDLTFALGVVVKTISGSLSFVPQIKHPRVMTIRNGIFCSIP